MAAHERRRMRWALALGATVLILSCVRQRREDVPQNGWWNERGPVVPHDTFPADCSLCHTGEGWNVLRDDFQYDHEQETGVALEGAHARAECLRCHNDRGPVAAFAARGCGGCHEDVHLGKLGVNCVDCHGEVNWRPQGQIEQHMRTRFPLVGAHAATACWRCHPGAEVGNFVGVDPDCITCHQDDLARANSPDHLAQGWVSDCDQCHIPTTWTGGGFNHGTWPLTGEHRVLDCTECHVGGSFAGTPRQCFACHDDDYLAANDPDHPGLGFPTDCERCHNTSSWRNARFDHGWISASCVTCHLDEYLNTNDPDHQAAGFPQSCEDCHNTKNWHNANFDHDFPINKGNHSKLDCAECHIVPGDFMVFTCTQCHEHTQSKMDDKHDEVNNYVYDTAACYSCHPNGKE